MNRYIWTYVSKYKFQEKWIKVYHMACEPSLNKHSSDTYICGLKRLSACRIAHFFSFYLEIWILKLGHFKKKYLLDFLRGKFWFISLALVFIVFPIFELTLKDGFKTERFKFATLPKNKQTTVTWLWICQHFSLQHNC